jgi:hypothetical protein
VSGAGIRVDPDGLKGFADGVRSDTTNGFEQGAVAARDTLDQRMPFGTANASVVVLAAKQRYTEALNVAMDNLKAYADMARILAEAAETVAAEFSGSDARSVQSVDRVHRVLSEAAAEVAAVDRARDLAAQHVDVGAHL